MVRKCLLVGLAIMLLVTLLVAVACGKISIPGRYVNQDNPSEYLELNEDGTLYLKEGGLSLDGEWEAEGNELRLRLMGMVATAKVKGNKIYDEDGKVWVKQSSLKSATPEPKKESITTTPKPTTPSQPTIKWKARIGGSPPYYTSSMVATRKVLYIPSEDNHLYALDTATGILKWQFETGGVPSTPKVVGNTVYFNSYGTIYALDVATGSLKWKVMSPASIVGVTYDAIYAESGSLVVALDASTGNEEWRFEPAEGGGGRGGVSHTLTSNSYYLRYYNHIYALNLATGRLRWKIEEPQSVEWLEASNEMVYYILEDSPFLTALDATTGEVKWGFKGPSPLFMRFLVGSQALYVQAHGQDRVYFVDSATGKSKISVSGKGGIHLYGNRLYTYTDEVSGEYLSTWDAQTGAFKSKVELPLAGFLEITENTLYLTSSWEYQNIYALDTLTGRLKWMFERPNLPEKSGARSAFVVSEVIVYAHSWDGWVNAIEDP